jgi:hypothetical protein
MEIVERSVFAESPDVPGPGVALLRAEVDLDLASVARGERELRAVAERDPHCRAVIVEFAPGTFVCVRGLHLLVDFADRLHDTGAHLFACAPPWGLARMLEILQIHSELTVVASVPDAMRAALSEQ